MISTMPAGAHVRVRTCSVDQSHVRFRGERGWAAANYLGRRRTGAALEDNHYRERGVPALPS